MDVGVALSLMSHRRTLSHCISEIFMDRHVARVCQFLPFQNEMASVSQSFSSRSVVGYLDRPQVVQKNTIFKRPPMVCLSVCLSSCNKRKPIVSCSFWQRLRLSSDGIPTLHLALFLSSSLCHVQKFCKDGDYFLNFIFVFLRLYQALSVSAVYCAFFGMHQANRTLSCSD